MRPLVFAVMLFPSAANAMFYSGNDIFSACEARSPDPGIFAAGVIDGAHAVSDWSGAPHRTCESYGVTVKQLGDVLCNYLEKDPAHRHMTAASLALNAFQEAFPCTN